MKKSLMNLFMAAFVLLATQASAQWQLTGNGATTPGTNFLGTTDAKDLVFKINSVEAMRILVNRNVGIGVTAPASLLSIGGNGNSLYKTFINNTNTSNGSTGLRVESSTPTGGANKTYSIFGSVPSGTGYTYGVFGSSTKATAGTSGRAYGVYGVASNGTTGYNYGVYGELAGTNNGAAVVGYDPASAWTGNTNGKWAGYFAGSVGITNRLGINNNVPAYRLDIADVATANNVIARFATTGGRRIIFVPQLGAAGWNNISQANDAGIFWSDNANANTSSGFVIAPNKVGEAGIRLDNSGNLTVAANVYKLGLGSAYQPALNFGTSYIGFNAVRTNAVAATPWNFSGDGANNGGNVIFGDVGGNLHFVSKASGGGPADLKSDSDILNGTKMLLTSNGKLVIGDRNTVTNTPNAYLLYVRDGILTEQVKVAVHGSAQWADYVFDEKYDLMPLEKVDAFVQANDHLPNMPSAQQIADEGGFELKQMAVKHQEKIEEIYLHLIELNKKIEALEAENAALKEAVTTGGK